ncbi:Uncharacterised protein [Bordetella pertussis]|nr:Uncharacterised protein [Bordetella pertussis]
MQLGLELGGRALGDMEGAAGQVEPGQAGARFALARDADRRQRAVGLGRQQGFVGQGAGRDDAHDAALDRPLGGGGIADLLADGDRFAQCDQARQVLLHGVHGNARHRDRRAVRVAALGQREVEQARGAFGVFIEHLVEVAHAVEQQQRPGLGFEAQVLLHHGSMAGQGVAGGLLWCGRHRQDCIGPPARSAMRQAPGRHGVAR